MPTFAFGWKPDLPDFRDLKYTAPEVAIPVSVDLRHGFAPPYNQGKLSSCTANAIAAAIQYDRIVEQEQDMTATPSRLFIYYNERVVQKWEKQDDGAYIRDGIKSIAKEGYCIEDLWPYCEQRVFDKPGDNVYQEAVKHKAVNYFRLDNTNLEMLKACLSDDFPFVFGLALYESFMSRNTAKTGNVVFPFEDEKIIGGHAMLCCGFSDERKSFLVRNSWGTEWGDGGYCWIPYEYMAHPNLGDDFWTIRICV